MKQDLLSRASLVAFGGPAPRPAADWFDAPLPPAVDVTHIASATEPEAQPAWEGFRVSQSYLDAKAAGNLKLPSISTEASGGDTRLVYEAFLYAPGGEAQVIDEGLYHKRSGVGVRIAFRVSSFDAKLSVNFATAAVAAQGGMADVEFQSTTHGFDTTQFEDLMPKEGSPMDAAAFKKIRAAVTAALQAISAGGAALSPATIYEYMGPSVAQGADSSARAVYFAMKRVGWGWKLSRALDAAKTYNLDGDTVQAVYTLTAGVKGLEDAPSEDARQRAKQWLHPTNDSALDSGWP